MQQNQIMSTKKETFECKIPTKNQTLYYIKIRYWGQTTISGTIYKKLKNTQLRIWLKNRQQIMFFLNINKWKKFWITL